ncbi:MAG: NAD(+)/NADH kinase [Gemmatimonadales bacterium]|nr:NAD(+)/NADH kinase [Gemmatimonadota bacterium]MBK7785156.1 NAD(+)/NADH kinase [Gemmatimonadota bacterium]MBP6670670.1 NAD(+)/NADH kinase [Gemmatimonadales bacterium]MBP9198507.1 NAD(+)/NADH kinase [Gemmatimonadales bacterium]
MKAAERLVIVTRRTRLEELLVRFNTRSQARFFLERGGAEYGDYEAEHETYHRSLDQLRRALDLGLPRQFIDRTLAPSYLFQASDLVVTVGQDGLVANVAKYATGIPIVAVNPDPARFDGVLLPFSTAEAGAVVQRALEGSAPVRRVTLAEAVLADGQRLLAFNDLFVGARSHVSARYRLEVGGATELQSSSGILVSTGAGSTGWMSSVFNMADGVAAFTGGAAGTPVRLAWEDGRLLFAVREPFRSRQSGVSVVAGLLPAGEPLRVESRMPAGGVIFSDGMESDCLPFDAGAIAEIRAAARHAHLVTRNEEP